MTQAKIRSELKKATDALIVAATKLSKALQPDGFRSHDVVVPMSELQKAIKVWTDTPK